MGVILQTTHGFVSAFRLAIVGSALVIMRMAAAVVGSFGVLDFLYATWAL